MRVLVCGSRDWTDYGTLKDTVLEHVGPSRSCTIIEGGARGADRLAAQVAQVWKCGHEQYPADWSTHGKKAGPIRNQQMLDEGKPELVLAFKDGFDHTLTRGGTEDMVRRARAAGIPTVVVGAAAVTVDQLQGPQHTEVLMSTVLNKDKLIVAQNSATAAAAIIAQLVATGQVNGNDITNTFEALRTDIYEGSISLGTEFAAPTLAAAPAYEPFPDPVAQVGAAFPNTTNVTGTPAAAVGGMPEVLTQLAGQPLPDWLPAQFAASACTPGEKLWDNRKDLPQFGGSRNPKAPWFKGKDSGEGVWPPR